MKDLKEKLNSEGIRVRNLEKVLDAAIDIGRDLGILTVKDEEVRMPFLLNGRQAFANIRLVTRPPNDNLARSKSAPGSSENKHRGVGVCYSKTVYICRKFRCFFLG